MNDNMDIKGKIPMRELTKLTNMTRATINFYIKEGVLPPPVKSAKNMAYYDADFVERLKVVEKMRKSNFSLNQIKMLNNSKVESINEMWDQIQEGVNMAEQPVTEQQIQELGFTDERIDEMIDLCIITPLGKRSLLFPAYTLTICKAVKFFESYKIPLSVIKEILDKLNALADIETKAFNEYIRGPMIESMVARDVQDGEVLRSIENGNALMMALHLQLLKRPAEEFLNF